MVSLQYQHLNLTAHPLPMGAAGYVVGLQPIGIRALRKSQIVPHPLFDQEPFPMDYLAYEDTLQSIITEDTGEEIGLG